MTSFPASKNRPPGEVCPACGGPLVEKQAHPFPVIPQILFGISFVAFMFLAEPWFANGARRGALLVWSLVQIGLGFWLVRARLRARQRLLRCIRCGQALPLNH